jgi:hypothetical protein
VLFLNECFKLHGQCHCIRVCLWCVHICVYKRAERALCAPTLCNVLNSVLPCGGFSAQSCVSQVMVSYCIQQLHIRELTTRVDRNVSQRDFLRMRKT